MAASPEYFAAVFPSDDFPRYAWTQPPAGLPERAWTTETTHRDGQQGGLPLSAAHSQRIYQILCAFTGDSGAIRQAEFFAYHDSDRQALTQALEAWRGGAPIEPTTWIRASRADAQLIGRLGVRETGMLASISDYHTFHKFKPGGRAQAAQGYLEAVATILDAGIRPRLHLEDATRAPLDFICAFIEAVLQQADSYGTELRPKFRLCDTLGVGLPFPQVEPPRGIPALFAALGRLGLEAADLEFHPHNDTHLVVANCLAAVGAGCGAINGTCLGKGERSGNAPLEGVLLHLVGMGYFSESRPDFTALNDLADLYAELGDPLPAKYPLYGRDAHRTRAGIHADGLNKFWPMYAPFDVPALLGRPLEVSLTRDSGLAGLVFLLRQHLQRDLGKNDPALTPIHQWVEDQFAGGRQTSIEWEELAPVAQRHLSSP
ncbi:MAG: pyruvate carboxyltransferase [Candidatus Latescibacteria bacterium]|nr:pyruvate carboxyltransferase [Candidatus Latescibacterota bacterium]